MSDSKRKGIVVGAAIWCVIIAGLAVVYKVWVHPVVESELIGVTGAESQYSQTVRLAADAFSGYAILRSNKMAKVLKEDRIKLIVEDDQADYVDRLRNLHRGKVDMAVFTVDALIAASAVVGKQPATIVMVIDETVGADAIVAYKKEVPSLQSLDRESARIVATPSSPSEFLARTMIATLNLPRFPNKWLKEAEGAGDCYKKLRGASGVEKSYAYVLWEPYVSKAKQDKAIHVLLDSSKMKGYIVDVLVARREFLKEKPDVVRKMVEAYSRAAYFYQEQPGGMVQLIREDAKEAGDSLSREEALSLVEGIQWKNTLENYAHMGIIKSSQLGAQHLEDIIAKVADVLVRTGSLDEDPIGDQAHTLFYKGIFEQLHAESFHPGKAVNILEGMGPGTGDLGRIRTVSELPRLDDEQWDKLTEVGAMRVEPVAFRRGTAQISDFSRVELDRLAERIQSWPTYYLRVVGHARAEGDQEANLLLAGERSVAVREYLISQGVSENRLRAQAASELSRDAEVSFVLGHNPY